MATTEERVDRLEIIMMELAEAQMRTQVSLKMLSDEMKDFKEEMKDFKDEMSDFKEEMKDFKNEMSDFKDEMRDFKEEMKEVYRALVTQRADSRCEYCQYPQEISNGVLDLEHIVPESLGGETKPDNLALSCRHCNTHKLAKVDGIDPHTGAISRLFHPRKGVWREHFRSDRSDRDGGDSDSTKFGFSESLSTREQALESTGEGEHRVETANGRVVGRILAEREDSSAFFGYNAFRLVFWFSHLYLVPMLCVEMLPSTLCVV